MEALAGLVAQPMVDLMGKRGRTDKAVSQEITALMEVPLVEVIARGPERVEILVIPKPGKVELALPRSGGHALGGNGGKAGSGGNAGGGSGGIGGISRGGAGGSGKSIKQALAAIALWRLRWTGRRG